MANCILVLWLLIVLFAVTGDVTARRSSKRLTYRQAFYKLKHTLRSCTNGMHICAFDVTQNKKRWCDIQCIPQSKVCDGTPDCRNKDDEENCVSACGMHKIQCIKAGTVDTLICATPCDRGTPECKDGRDEDEERCRCEHGKFRCIKNDNTSGCVTCCDGGLPECLDGSDERVENCRCNDTQYRCIKTDGTSGCATLCDGRPAECMDGSDEMNCVKTCSEHYMLCRNGSHCAVPCDGCMECQDGEDEHSCTEKTIDNFVVSPCCPDRNGSDVVCLPLDTSKTNPITATACDGDVECRGGRDEWLGCRFCDCTVNTDMNCCNIHKGRPCKCPAGVTPMCNCSIITEINCCSEGQEGPCLCPEGISPCDA